MPYFYKKTISYYKDKIVSPPSYLYNGNVYTVKTTSLSCDSPGGTPKKFWGGCAAPVFDRIPLAKEILVENIPLTYL